MKKVLAYCRVSSEEQEKTCSLDEQERQIRSYCARHGYYVVEAYHENYSAKNYDMKRPKMKLMYEYCKKHRGEISKILFLRWDRYSRNVEFAFAYKRKFYDELGVEINAIESPIDFKGTEWSTTMAIYCGVAHTEDDKISRRTRDGIHGTLLKGRCSNKAPRGYKNVIGQKIVIVDKDTAPLVSEAFEEVAKGIKTPTLVMKEVKAKGLKVSKSSFFEMLRNHFYCGEVYVPAYLDEPAQYVKGIHEPLVSMETFMQVQSRINTVAERNRSIESKRKAKVVKLPHDDYYFYPFLQCPICGAKITASHSTGRSQRYAYYHCNKCRKYRIPAQKMNEDILRYISKIRPCKAVLDLYEEVLGDIRTERFKGINKEKNRIMEDINKIKARLERLQDEYYDKEDRSAEDIEEFNETKQRYKNEIHTLQCKVEAMKAPNRTVIEPRVAYAMSFINNMVKCLSDVEMSVKMDVLGSIFSGKMVFEDGKCRTAEFNPVISLMIGKSSICEDENKSGVLDFSKTPLQYPEPCLKCEIVPNLATLLTGVCRVVI